MRIMACVLVVLLRFIFFMGSICFGGIRFVFSCIIGVFPVVFLLPLQSEKSVCCIDYDSLY